MKLKPDLLSEQERNQPSARSVSKLGTREVKRGDEGGRREIGVK